MAMFRKVLVANRGEIAVRVMRTLREMGISPIAVHSEADRAALHVRMADEAYEIGPAPSADSYLRIDRIIDACKKSGADAVHPGYGFLSENPTFSQACADAGVVFIGPEASAMVAMGHKTAARDKMVAAGVPVVPGAHVDDPAQLLPEAERVGYPVMLKAASGGGGKGMRLVDKPEDLVAAFERARDEAKNAFGDPTVYLEKAIVRPRHIEIQVLSDGQGQVVHLFERDCSIQRRHQKVVEETPSPAPPVNDELVAQMGEVAVRAAEAVNYRSAGTVEFLMGEDGSFYFLEMNTRLQVEHPITELITGIDLVREMVRVAAGERLGYDQSAVRRQGHAIECRVYAEDPATGFLPSPGRIDVLRVPAGPGIRDDSGTYQGAEITGFYDPLISKLSVWAPDRPRAVARMRRALGEYVVGGIRTNLPFHLALFSHPEFVDGQYDTGFIGKHKDVLHTAGNAGDAAEAFAVAAAVAEAQAETERAARAAAQGNGSAAAAGGAGLSPWRLGALPRQ
ncbi:MAG TPA: acetyl-CoA carboxylase biotin carboxylase subunit [Polyangiaceae bacterium LLY-WYZ-14_1]|nr:acetyl-CoA carboxylase biotin carboxylase subunit [Polyangiaceae bacterium LLY-WYZ-14_1]